MGFYQPITGLYSVLIIKPRNFAKRQCKLQWLTPPKLPNASYLDNSFPMVSAHTWLLNRNPRARKEGAGGQDHHLLCVIGWHNSTLNSLNSSQSSLFAVTAQPMKGEEGEGEYLYRYNMRI